MALGVVARIGRFCFRHRWAVIGVWLVVVVLGGLTFGPVFSAIADPGNPKHVEAIDGLDAIATGNDSSGTVIGLVDNVDPEAPAVRTAIDAAAADLAGATGVTSVATPYSVRAELAPAYLATDKRGLLIVATLAKLDRGGRDKVLDTLRTRLHRVDGDLDAAGVPQATVEVGGNPVINADLRGATQADLGRAELISLPLTLIVLVFVFGGLVAAGLPVLAAAVSVAAAMPLLWLFSRVTDLDQNVVTVVTLLGLGLSIDYGLLLVARYREEVAAGFEPEEAVGRAWATAGRTIFFSALTVAAALSGLLTFSIHQLSALGVGGVSVAVVAMLAALTFTAALIGTLHKRIKPSAKQRRRGDEQGFFAALSRFVQRRPVLVALGATLLLLAAGSPLLGATIKLPKLEGVPRSIESARVADELAARYGRTYKPVVTVVARTDAGSLDAYAARWASDPAVGGVQAAKPAGPGVATVDLTLKGGAQDQAAKDLVHRLRADRPAGVQSWVIGDAATLVDLVGLIVDDLPAAVAVTLIAMIVLLFAMTGSVVVPIKAVLANVVSLGATFGVMVAVFEHGWGAGVLHTLTIGGLDPFVVVIVFAFAFGLSMDYEVFLLGRIKEYVERGDDTDTAVRRGLQHTGRIITSAALLMVIVFACFAAADLGQIEQVGLGLLTAVVIDATVVRCLLVPATMTLLGRFNWWAPGPLQRLHTRIGLREHALPEAEPERETVTVD
ncbi:MMPL family transporter [Dactylosporangium matsuzakiense]|uniref:Membrane protein n=1 Tax=Dactylosporangium matsuzakiense TaxID=53360 RepID=A0A9W6KRN9_9ACTN|nr:MMPL family transporter [Dactylosporangium matsuzakiense]GLL05434.1 putative membrane protein [Dactylosporangium matsuzakiense]